MSAWRRVAPVVLLCFAVIIPKASASNVAFWQATSLSRCDNLLTPSNLSIGAIYVTGLAPMSANHFVFGSDQDFERSIFAKPNDEPLVVFHESEWEEAHGRQPLDVSAASTARNISACWIDTFVAEPWLWAVSSRDPSSGIEAYHAFAGDKEPFARLGSGRLSKLLCRKVAAIHHAVSHSPDGTLVVWVDIDVSTVRPLDHRFAKWARKRDVSYIPFRHSSHQTAFAKHQPATDVVADGQWRIESGIFVLHVSHVTRIFVAVATEYYRFRMNWLVRHCLQEGVRKRTCSYDWLAHNTYFNDIFVYSLLLHADLSGDEARRFVWGVNVTRGGALPGTPSLRAGLPLGQGLRHGFFSHGRPDRPGRRNDMYMSSGHDAHGDRARAEEACSRYPHFNFFPAGRSDDTSTSPKAAISPFSLCDYLVHHMQGALRKSVQTSIMDDVEILRDSSTPQPPFLQTRWATTYGTPPLFSKGPWVSWRDPNAPGPAMATARSLSRTPDTIPRSFVQLLAGRDCVSPGVKAAVGALNAANTASALRGEQVPLSGRSSFGGGFYSTPTVPCAEEEQRYWIAGDFTAFERPNHCCNFEPAVGKCPAGGTLSIGAKNIRSDEPIVCVAHIPPRCTLLSFGIAGQWSFEEALAQHGCEVLAFDPTIRRRESHERGAIKLEKRLASHGSKGSLAFHFHGLAGGNPNQQQGVNRSSYGAVAVDRLLDLPTIVRRFVRNDEANLILKVDCEGCEWEAIDFAARSDPRLLSRFSLIILEVHVVESLLMRGEHGLALFSSFYDTLVDVHGFRLSYLHENPGGYPDRHVHPELQSLGLKASLCCYEIVLVNPKVAAPVRATDIA